MVCGRCKEEKESNQFTKGNLSKDGKKGLCKKCKKERDNEFRQKKNNKDNNLEYFELKSNLLERDKKEVRIGFLKLYKYTDRKKSKGKEFEDHPSIGSMAILDELNEPYEICYAEDINNYEFILISLMSVMDIENLIYTFEKFAPLKIIPKIIVGGFGVCNIKLIIKYIDIAIWGRGEGQINQIIAGDIYSNVWRKESDPNLLLNYTVRQPRYLVKGEASVGCRNNCAYCQYTNIRKPLNNGEIYNPGTYYSNVVESDWNALKIDKAGLYTSAWDGWSDDTRKRVNKPVTDKSIADKLIDISNSGINGGVAIKIFQIVGYPWETQESVIRDIEHTVNMLKAISSQLKSRIVLTFMCTPFGAEPLTPMANDRVQIEIDWHGILNGIEKYDDGILCMAMIPAVSSSFTLLKRMLIHRAEIGDIDRYKQIVFSRELNRMKKSLRVEWLLKYNIIGKEEFLEWNGKAISYLSIENPPYI